MNDLDTYHFTPEAWGIAERIVKAVTEDESTTGSDISSGMFGHALSRLVDDLAKSEMKLHGPFIREFRDNIFVVFDRKSDGAEIVGAYRCLAEAEDALSKNDAWRKTK